MTLIPEPLRELLRIQSDNADLMRSQVKVFTRQIPVLYFILGLDAGALAFTFRHSAPGALTAFVPALLIFACLARLYAWTKTRDHVLDDASLVRRLKVTVALTVVLGVAFLGWSICLFGYGDAYQQAHVIFYVGITVIACVVCLSPLPLAALPLAGVVVIPFVTFLMMTRQPVYIAIGVNLLLAVAASLYVLINYSRGFADLIASDRKLAEARNTVEERRRETAEAQVEAQAQALKNAQRFQVALNSLLHGLCMFDANQRLIVCNTYYAKMYGLPESLTQRGTPWTTIVAHRMETIGYRELSLEQILEQRSAYGHNQNEWTATRHLGDGRTILIRHQPLPEGGWVGIHEDITERDQVEERLTYMARHDALTGLPNRVLLHERIEQAVATLERDESFAVVCIDLDHFKETNDALGHSVGDAILREIAARLKRCVSERDTLARIGGDEFAIVRVSETDHAALSAFVGNLLKVLTEPYWVEDHCINIGASAGIARAPQDAAAGAPLSRMADIALYHAKENGRRGLRFFEPAMDAQLQSRHRLETDLRNAIAANEIEVFFQPIHDAKTSVIRSFEALARWRHRELGMISPAEFIPLAEQNGLIIEIGEWILRAACFEAATWPNDVRVSVNVSVRQFGAADLVATVVKALRDSGLSARRLELEITESVLLDGSGDKLAALIKLRVLGVRVALDDFGTGYSSLSYLRSFPFDKIKIDQSFVKSIGERGSNEIVRMIANLGETLEISTTAEGVETHAQLARMIEYGCQEVQGFLFSRPVPADEASILLQRFNTPRQAMSY